ncbi:hypothetical protein [Mycobacterium sp.]|uniref:hypothetical protein n=1 Tax=Mycobacterium sp. TaxID=1785 RepID=UPI0025CEA368|nr:hypothetical protein [Mycobacterium sp.]
MRAASKALSVLPRDATIVDQAVRDNPEWAAAARTAADLYGQAGDDLATGIAPGTTALLNQNAIAAAAALRALSIAEKTLDATNGNAYHAAHETGDTMDVLCERWAPR